jgi:acetaldehyde dehydrogenase / alcohol dehydrogenase
MTDTQTAPVVTTPIVAPTPAPVPALSDERLHHIDSLVDRAHAAAEAFRALDQEQVDAIVSAMVRAGIRAAGELAALAIEETGFGVFEDKVVKNYVATEFLSDYLRDKRSVGVIEEDVEHDIVRVAEPIGVVLAITPVTNPTSTVLYKAIVAAKTRNAVIFRPSPYAVRSCARSVDILREAAEAAGMPPGALQVIPDLEHEVTHYLFKHPQVDFIWVTGGPKIVALANAAGKPGLCVGPGNAPIYVHRTAGLKGAVVDILISKTFDASVICPAEQTCIVDEPVYDELLAEFQRMGAHLLTTEQVDALVEFAFGCGDRVNMAALGQQAPELAKRAGFTVDPATKILLAPLPSDLEELDEHPLVQEKLMPVLGVVRSPSVEHGVQAAVLVTEHGGLGHTSAVYARDEDVVAATAARGVIDEVRRHLECDAVHVIGDIEPEPGEARVRAGVELLDGLRPDLLVAVGGGSVIDAAKAMRLFHEHPELSLRELALPFLDAGSRPTSRSSPRPTPMPSACRPST